MAVALSLVATFASAHGGVTDPTVLARMQGMSAMAEHMKTIGDMAKGGRSFDAVSVENALARLSEEAARVPGLFETKVTDPKSEARAVIWEDFGTFAGMAEDLRLVSSGLSGSVATDADLPEALQTIGEACKACHADYRVETP